MTVNQSLENKVPRVTKIYQKLAWHGGSMLRSKFLGRQRYRVMVVRKYKKTYIYNKKSTYDKILKIINDIF